MRACPSCQAELLPHLPLCLECGHEPPAPARVSRRFAVDELPDNRVPLASALSALTRLPRPEVTHVLALPSLEITAEVTPAEQEELEELLRACGARARVNDHFVADPKRSLTWRWRELPWGKVATTAAVAASAVAYDVPLAAWGSAVTATVLLARPVHLVAHQIVIDRDGAAACLGTVDEPLLREAQAVRRKLVDPDAVAAFRACFGEYLEAAFVLRRGGGHLLRSELTRVDGQLTRQLRTILSLSATADRLGRARTGPERSSLLEGDVRTEESRQRLLANLHGIARKLRHLGASVVELRGGDASDEAVNRVLDALNDLQSGIEGDLVLGPPGPAAGALSPRDGGRVRALPS